MRVLAPPCFALVALAAATVGPAGLRIEVLRGAGANNNAESGSSVSPVVRIVDAAGAPVPQALVVFAAPSSGPSVEFAGHGPVAQVLSDDAGEASAPHVRPAVADGEVEIRVTATKNGGSASLSILQMNVGVEKKMGSAGDLEIVMAPETGAPAPPQTTEDQAPRLVRFRVESPSGKPVPGVEVQVSVVAVKAPGKTRELDRFKQVSAADGQIVAVVPRHSGGDPLEIVLQAAWNGRFTTRYFELRR
jgi:hypothetical protein